jgi:hypothetical protein
LAELDGHARSREAAEAFKQWPRQRLYRKDNEEDNVKRTGLPQPYLYIRSSSKEREHRTWVADLSWGWRKQLLSRCRIGTQYNNPNPSFCHDTKDFQDAT